MKHEITTTWKSGMSFENDIDGFKSIVDASTEFGGNDFGPSPKKLLLAGLAGCTGMDIVSLLKKMRETLTNFHIKIEAEMTNEHPKIYSDIIIKYYFKTSDNLNHTNVDKAIKMSQETYCGVAAMLRKGSNLNYEIIYE